MAIPLTPLTNVQFVACSSAASSPHGELKPLGVGQQRLSLKLSKFTHALGNCP